MDFTVTSGMFDILRAGLIGMTYALIVGSYFLLLLIYALGMTITGFVGHLYWTLKRPRKRLAKGL